MSFWRLGKEGACKAGECGLEAFSSLSHPSENPNPQGIVFCAAAWSEWRTEPLPLFPDRDVGNPTQEGSPARRSEAPLLSPPPHSHAEMQQHAPAAAPAAQHAGARTINTTPLRASSTGSGGSERVSLRINCRRTLALFTPPPPPHLTPTPRCT